MRLKNHHEDILKQEFYTITLYKATIYGFIFIKKINLIERIEEFNRNRKLT